jgi:GNAT superfamily N-acetyltransferase
MPHWARAVIRKLLARDLGEVSALLRRIRRDHLHTERGLKHWIDSIPERAGASWWVADEGGVVGYALAMRRWWQASNDAYAWVGVAPEVRGRGVGGALWEAAERHVELLDVDSLLSDVLADTAGEAFLEARGFRPDRLDRVSALDPVSVDLDEFHRRLERARADGYELVALADVSDLRAVYELVLEVADDMPGSGAPHTFSFEEWKDVLLQDPNLDANASAIVLHAGRPVSIALLSVDPESRQAHNDQTGTARAHRGRGLATLAKLSTIRWARGHGVERIITDNAEANAAMLAINDRLGYRAFVGRRRWIREANRAADRSRS